MTRDNKGSRYPDVDDYATAQERAWLERSGAIARGDPKAPPPKAPAGGSATLKPKGGSEKK